MTGLAHSLVTFGDDREKLNFMRELADEYSRHPAIVELAQRLTRRIREPFDQVATLHRFVRDGIRYERDPNRREQLATPTAVLAKGYDDCDGKVVLCCSLVRAIGIDDEPHPLWLADILRHVQHRARWPGSERAPVALRAPGGWIRGELTIRGAEFGQNPYELPRDPQTGKLPVV